MISHGAEISIAGGGADEKDGPCSGVYVLLYNHQMTISHSFDRAQITSSISNTGVGFHSLGTGSSRHYKRNANRVLLDS